MIANIPIEVIGVGVLILATVGYACLLLVNSDPVSKRLQAMGTPVDNLVAAPQTLRYSNNRSPLFLFLAKVGALFQGTDPEKRQNLQRRLVRGGFFDPLAPQVFFAARLITTAIAGAFAVFIGFQFSETFALSLIIIFVANGIFIGFMMPEFFLKMQISQRQESVRRGLPEALDMLMVCVGGGSTLASGFQRVGVEYQNVNKTLADEFRHVSLELQAGIGRADALRNLAERVHIEELNSLVGLLIQSEQMGASLSRTLRIYAAEMRKNRMLRAEEEATKLPLKISMVICMLILPAVLLIILTPIAITMVENLGKF